MANNKKLLEEINRHCSPTSLLVINGHGILIRIYSPFKVRPVESFYIFNQKDILLVDYVRLSEEMLMLYVIRKVAYPYYYFLILL